MVAYYQLLLAELDFSIIFQKVLNISYVATTLIGNDVTYL